MENSLKFICFDAEMTDRGELLELSIYSGDGSEVYHQYFKPFYQKRWRTDIHHITPEMVKDKPFFAACRRSIQRIIDHSEYLIGFAIDNDTRKLQAEGIKNLDKKKIMEVRDWYWLIYGNDRGTNINDGPGLQVVAPELGIEFGEKSAHSASGDTEVTLKCFMTLVERFKERFANETWKPNPTLEETIGYFETEYAAARRRFRELKAKGELLLIDTPDGMKLAKTSNSDGNVVASITVNDRFKAEFEIKKKFLKRCVGQNHNLYALKPSDIEWFKTYDNEFVEDDSELYKKLLKARNITKF